MDGVETSSEEARKENRRRHMATQLTLSAANDFFQYLKWRKMSFIAQSINGTVDPFFFPSLFFYNIYFFRFGKKDTPGNEG